MHGRGSTVAGLDGGSAMMGHPPERADRTAPRRDATVVARQPERKGQDLRGEGKTALVIGSPRGNRSDGDPADPADPGRPRAPAGAGSTGRAIPRIGDDVGHRWRGLGALGVPLAAALDRAGADVVIDFSLPAGTLALAAAVRRAADPAGRGHDRVRARAEARSPGAGGGDDSAPDLAEPEPGGQPADAAGRRGGPGAGRCGRHRDRRTPPPLQEGRPQRHGAAAGGDRRAGDRVGPGSVRPRPTAARSASDRVARSASTPCAPATTPASTPSSSA